MKDSKVRFGDRADDYRKYRPSYPLESLQFVRNRCGIKPEWSIADIGSGTGISAKALLDVMPCRVYAVEPNDRMRQEAETSLSSRRLFHSIKGSAEDTTLADKSINLIAAFQAFHWFSNAEAKIEFRRISAAPHWILIAWNYRMTEGSRFLEGYEAMLRTLPEYRRVKQMNPDKSTIEGFIGDSDLTFAEFPNSQDLDFEALTGRFFSSSYTPSPRTAEARALRKKLSALFAETNENGFVKLTYKTQIYLGKMRDDQRDVQLIR